MIEFVLKNRKLRLHPDGIMYVRAQQNGVETKSEKWKEIKFTKRPDGYMKCVLTLDKRVQLFKQRMVYYAHNQDWNIFDSSRDNSIDHINGIRDDNRIENLRRVTNQQNQFNRTCKGYCLDKKSGKWRACIGLNGRTINIGRFKTEEEAHNAYIKKKEELHLI